MRTFGFKAVLIAAAAVSMAVTPAAAQIREIDPDTAIDGDLAPGAPGSGAAERDTTVSSTPRSTQVKQQSRQATDPADGESAETASSDGYGYDSVTGGGEATAETDPETGAQPTDQTTTAAREPASAGQTGPTYKKDDLIGAAEGVFGKGAKGLAGILEKVLKDQGEPNAYISGREASGAFVVGLRYGSGTLYHKVEGERPAYWTGPSLGFDVGGNAAKTFVLVYNLYDSQELFKRFPAGEGNAYFVGGFTASYMRSGDVVLIPIRLGVGYRLGVNAGYMKFTEKQKWLPF